MSKIGTVGVADEFKDQYLQHLKTMPMEYKALLIAQDHLGSSFELGRSNGFQDWMRAMKLKHG